MINRTRSCCLASLLVAAASALGQAPATLAEAIAAMRWDAAKQGPLLVVEAENVRRSGKGTGLLPFGRKRVAVGGLTAVVPTEMVTIDDTFGQPADVYDGLPRDAKMLYLLSTLTSAQWKAAAGRGLGMADLNVNQRAVFRSILPAPLDWRAYRVDAKGNLEDDEEKGTVAEDQLSRVRIRLQRRTVFELNLKDESGAYTVHGTESDYGSPGSIVYRRVEDAEFDRSYVYGVVARKKVENKAKPSDLANADPRLETLVDIPPRATVRQFLRHIGDSAGVELHADMRVADLKVSVVGSRVRAKDALQALALAVTGTYRRVGPAFVLTSDLIGLGARKLRFAIWYGELQRSTFRRSEEWRQEIAQSGGFKGVGYDPESPLQPNAAMLKWMEAGEARPRDQKLDASRLTPALRGFLERVNKQYPTQQVNTDLVVPKAALEYRFVLPDGRALHPEGQTLGEEWNLRPRKPYVPRPVPAVALPLTLPSGADVPLALKIVGAEQARSAIALAAEYGFKSVWAETTDGVGLLATIRAGKEHGVAVRLVVRPWKSEPSAKVDQDLTLLGMTGSVVDSYRRQLASWTSNLDGFSFGAPRVFDVVPPNSSAGNLERLARMPDLAGVVVLDTQPEGYAGKATEVMYGGFETEQGVLGQFGYSSPMRLAFLRNHSIDPIDLAEGKLHCGVDLRQPFFLDDALRGGNSMYNGTNSPHPGLPKAAEAWNTFRGERNSTATLAFLERIASAAPGIPIQVELRTGLLNYLDRAPRILRPWTSGQPLAVTPAENPQGAVLGAGGMAFLPLSTEWPAPPRPLTPQILASPIVGKELSVAVDATEWDPAKLALMLERYFKRKASAKPH